MSCDVFPYDRMNEKWCSDTLEKLLNEANVRSHLTLSPSLAASFVLTATHAARRTSRRTLSPTSPSTLASAASSS